MTTMRWTAPLFIFLLPLLSCDRVYSPRLIDTGSDSSFRGLSVVDDNVAWVSGTAGSVGRTNDGGRTWNVETVPGFDSSDFRGLYAFDGLTALVANAGSPAYILRTTDAAGSWDTVYVNAHPDAFIDGLDFWNERDGLMYGDPIDGRLLVIRTHDGGRNWAELPTDSRPLLDAGEYSFAASGTGIRCYGESRVIISTGGTVSRLWSSEDNGGSWTASQTPIIQGLPTAGIFSFTFLTGERAIIVGGDFQRDSLMMDHVFYSTNGGAEWKAPTAATRGYRECVEVLDGNEVIATGPGGTDISYDGGEHWSALWDERGFHVVRKARNGTLALMAGGGGKLAILE